MKLLEIDWRPGPRKLREFAAALLVFSVLFGLYLHFARGAPWTTVRWVIGAGAAIGSLGLWRPSWMRPIFLVLTAVTLPIGMVVSTVLLATLYYVVVTPIGLLRRALGGDPLERRLDPAATTYWKVRKPSADVQRYFHQY